MFQVIANSGHQVEVVQRHLPQAVCQDFGFLTNRKMLVHDKDGLALYPAEPAFGVDAGGPQVLLGN